LPKARHQLARFAEQIFWLARYMERAENLARILDVNESFAQDRNSGPEWLSLLQLNVDEARFFERQKQATAAAVIDFYVLDRENPTSIVSDLRAARENARAVRHLISTEMWLQLNVFYNEIAALRQRDTALDNLSRLCARIKESCQAHAGITEGTLYRDEIWCFHQLGKYMERADQTSRLLDITYHRLINTELTEGSAPDVSQWNALLRSAAGYQAYRRTHPRGLTPESVAAFLVHDPAFPRSMASCIAEVSEQCGRLRETHGLAIGRGMTAELRRLERMTRRPAKRAPRMTPEKLHAFIDRFQMDLVALTREMARTYFLTEVE
jgi:uncharacterized alpha-E superfamily protein